MRAVHERRSNTAWKRTDNKCAIKIELLNFANFVATLFHCYYLLEPIAVWLNNIVMGLFIQWEKEAICSDGRLKTCYWGDDISFMQPQDHLSEHVQARQAYSCLTLSGLYLSCGSQQNPSVSLVSQWRPWNLEVTRSWLFLWLLIFYSALSPSDASFIKYEC